MPGRVRLGNKHAHWGNATAWDPNDLHLIGDSWRNSSNGNVWDNLSSFSAANNPPQFLTSILTGQTARHLQMEIFNNDDSLGEVSFNLPDQKRGADVYVLSLDSTETVDLAKISIF